MMNYMTRNACLGYDADGDSYTLYGLLKLHLTRKIEMGYDRPFDS